jgi:hypothetical protein
MSPRRQKFVLANRELLNPLNDAYIRFYAQQARDLQIAPDSDAEDEHILAGVREELSHLERMRNRARENIAPRPAQAREDALQTAPTPAPMPAPKKSAPMAAAPSREVPTMTGRPSNDQPSLTAEEREIARISFPHLPAVSAEYEYFKNKKRYQQLKIEGVITDGGR